MWDSTPHETVRLHLQTRNCPLSTGFPTLSQEYILGGKWQENGWMFSIYPGHPHREYVHRRTFAACPFSSSDRNEDHLTPLPIHSGFRVYKGAGDVIWPAVQTWPCPGREKCSEIFIGQRRSHGNIGSGSSFRSCYAGLHWWRAAA